MNSLQRAGTGPADLGHHFQRRAENPRRCRPARPLAAGAIRRGTCRPWRDLRPRAGADRGPPLRPEPPDSPRDRPAIPRRGPWAIRPAPPPARPGCRRRKPASPGRCSAVGRSRASSPVWHPSWRQMQAKCSRRSSISGWLSSMSSTVCSSFLLAMASKKPRRRRPKQRGLKILEDVARIVVAELDAGRAVVAQHAAPEGIVQVEDQALRGRAQQRARPPGPVRGPVAPDSPSSNPLGPCTTGCGSVHRCASAAGHDSGVIEDVGVGDFGQIAGQLPIGLGQQMAKAVGIAGVEQVQSVTGVGGPIRDQNRSPMLRPGGAGQTDHPLANRGPNAAGVAAGPMAMLSWTRCRSTSSSRNAIHSTSGDLLPELRIGRRAPVAPIDRTARTTAAAA